MSCSTCPTFLCPTLTPRPCPASAGVRQPAPRLRQPQLRHDRRAPRTDPHEFGTADRAHRRLRVRHVEDGANREKATLVFEPFERLPEKDRDALTEEGGTARPLRGGARGHRGGRGSIRRENLENHRPSHHRRNPARTAVVSGPPWISKPSRYSCTHPDRTVMLYTRRGIRAR